MTVIKHFFLILLLTGCAMKSTQIKTVDEVDINRFMGDWYVLAHIPSYVEKNAFNAVESYKLNEDGSIATTFTFNEGSLDGPVKTYHPKALLSQALIMLSGGCNLYGRSKLNIKLLIWTKITK